MTTIGFIGLGHMGQPMASNLLAAGHALLIFDVTPTAIAALEQKGAKACAIADIAKQADVIFTSVQTGEQVKQICLGTEGIFAHAKPGLLFIDCSSIDIDTTRALHEIAEAKKICMLDAPVSGGVSGASAGTLTIMVGGTQANFERAESLLKILGKKVIYAGNAGSGQAAKICNNLLLAINMVGVSEAFSLAEKLGLQPQKFFEIAANSSGQCWAMTSYCPVPNVIDHVPANVHYEPGFMAKMMLKDLNLATEAAKGHHAFIPLGERATALYQELVHTKKDAEKDFSAIFQLIKSEH